MILATVANLVAADRHPLPIKAIEIASLKVAFIFCFNWEE
jgi:hypothetical protein